MSNFYLCDNRVYKSYDISATDCVCYAAPIEKIVVSDDDDRPLNEICPLYEERDA